MLPKHYDDNSKLTICTNIQIHDNKVSGAYCLKSKMSNHFLKPAFRSHSSQEARCLSSYLRKHSRTWKKMCWEFAVNGIDMCCSSSSCPETISVDQTVAQVFKLRAYQDVVVNIVDPKVFSSVPE